MTTPDPRTHPEDELVLLATGHPVPPEVAAHVDGCSPCTEEVAALREVAGLLHEPPDLVEPPAGLWDKVVAELDRDDRAARDERDRATAPALTVVDTAPSPSPGRRVRVGWLVAAAAAGVLVGGLGVRALDGPEPSPATVVLGETSLQTLDTRQALGAASAVRVDDHLDLDVETPALDARGGYLEVWLINRDLKRMVSVGVLRPGDGVQRFAIGQDLIDEGYVIVDISREGYDDKPQHSGDSVARGTLAL
ncbi:anti-sigma factor [Phycicoccus sp.]|uniref:anti-sigma factor n=1 Tax=Phycicoccus sp. TaxID=1902410 RepID=UPI002B8FF2F0|nr:anti-sigma factor [Phycicoccus sp.]HMM94586.1 anti-sigma factor [Phycicoccus sp.]